jgi:hypothetical protein
MRKELGWLFFAVLFAAASSACVAFSRRGGVGAVSPPPMRVSVPPEPSSSPTQRPRDDLPHTVIPLPTGFGTDQTVSANDVRGGNAGLLSIDHQNRGGWLWLGLP